VTKGNSFGSVSGYLYGSSLRSTPAIATEHCHAIALFQGALPLAET